MNILRRVLFPVSFAVALALAPAFASACPMCNQSIQEDKSLPMAYQASILFMLGMPFAVGGGLGGLIYYKFQQHEKAMLAAYALQTAHAGAGVVNDRGLRA